MSILKSHWTDTEIADFALQNLREVYAIAGLDGCPRVEASTFFLNPRTLGVSDDPRSMNSGVLAKLREILPAEVLRGLPNNASETFRLRADLAYFAQGVLHVVLSRPNDSSSLEQRIAERTQMVQSDFDLASHVVCGFDNLELINRLHQISNSLLNGGSCDPEEGENAQIIKYRSMLGAKRIFMKKGGDQDTIALHEATAHVGFFTNAHRCPEYTGFMYDLGYKESVIDLVYISIFQKLAKAGHVSRVSSNHGASYAPMTTAAVVVGIHELLETYENQITHSGGKALQACMDAISCGHASQAQDRLLRSLSYSELMKTIEHFIVFQTAKGLKTLMGKNMRSYIPERGVGAFARINKLFRQDYQ